VSAYVPVLAVYAAADHARRSAQNALLPDYLNATPTAMVVGLIEKHNDLIVYLRNTLLLRGNNCG
jgi:hypothetical protein